MRKVRWNRGQRPLTNGDVVLRGVLLDLAILAIYPAKLAEFRVEGLARGDDPDKLLESVLGQVGAASLDDVPKLVDRIGLTSKKESAEPTVST